MHRPLQKIIKSIMLERMPVPAAALFLSVLSTGTANPNLLEYAGLLYEERGDYRRAQAAYQRALHNLERLDAPRVPPRKQSYQFHLERLHYIMGKTRVEDPLFKCRILPCEEETEAGATPEQNYSGTLGSYSASFEYNGLLIQFSFPAENISFVDLLIDGVVFRRISTAQGSGAYRYTVKRPALEYFPKSGVLELRASNGLYLEAIKSKNLLISVPHGKGDLAGILQGGLYLGKKGDLPVDGEEIKQRQERYLDLYASARDFFDIKIGRPLFLMYGTLLGLYRDGGFIEDDDDFDLGYISEESEPMAVKEESKRIMTKLVEAGYIVFLNDSGRPFRLRRKEDDFNIHLDIRPVWKQNDMIWAHTQTYLPCRIDDFIPAEKTLFHQTPVYMPCNPEAFLVEYYGHAWETPDPSYPNDITRVGSEVLANLAKACLNQGEFIALRDMINRRTGMEESAGELVYKSVYDLYPLDRYEANCGWS